MTFPIVPMRASDFDSRGNLRETSNPVSIVLVGRPTCPWCVKAKPAFHAFSNRAFNTAFCGEIDLSSMPDVAARINTINPGHSTVPAYIKYVHGKRTDEKLTDRSVEGLARFAGVSL